MEKEDFLRLVNNTSHFSKKFVSKSYSLMRRIRKQMEEKDWEQKDLAKALGKSEPEISKWLSGFHNLTFKSIMKLEEALGCDLIEISKVDEPRPRKERKYAISSHFDVSKSLESTSLPLNIEYSYDLN
ncbi:MAG: helix-turn-helix transcriptional regulator [Saprospiraceae bacterium]|nr:helix-turn-helix transcriptional regulator [Saprospiraceae bacterium]